MTKQKLLLPFTCLITALGAVACLYAAYNLPDVRLDLRLFALALVTLVFSSRLIVTIPRVRGEVNVSDTFIFLTMLLYGGEAAVLLAAAESLCTSLRFCKKRLTVFFNVGMMATATTLTVLAVRALFGSIRGVAASDYSAQFVTMLAVMALVQYVSNAGLAAVRSALRTDQPIYDTWVNGYLWTCITYFAGASAAGIIAKLIGSVGASAFVVTAPIIAIVYFTYRTYLKNVEVSHTQAEQARAHVEELSRHIEEQERISRRLQESEEHFRSAFEHAAGMAQVGLDGRWLRVNKSLCQMLGYPEGELLGGNFQDITNEEDLGRELANTHRLLKGSLKTSQLEKRFRHKLGHEVWALTSASVVSDAQGAPSHFIFQIQDITERKRAEDQVHHAAFHDALTGLPNRILLSERLSLAVERAKRWPEYRFAVLFIDLDRFKVVNDSLGHPAGDLLLVEVARRLQRCVRATDTVARLGGDEFAVLLENTDDEHSPTGVAGRVHQQLSVPFDLDGHEVFTSASIGIACSTGNYERPEDILRDSDTAMYRAKSNGKARYAVFDREMHTRAVEQLTLESELRRAVERGEIGVHYQPLVSLSTGRLVGFEALARWRHAQRGYVPPDEFIRLAEETGLITLLGEQVLRQACAQVRAWQREFAALGPLVMSVNLSAKQFHQDDLVARVKRVLGETGLAAESLCLEVTESVLMEQVEQAQRMLDRLNALGVRLALDDFGTGYSSLAYLHRFPFDVLKVDRSFVNRMGADDAEGMKIVKTIIALASELGIDVAAEGVEVESQRAQLAGLGCAYGQGYLFSRPLDVAAARAYMAAAIAPPASRDGGEAGAPESAPAAKGGVAEMTYSM